MSLNESELWKIEESFWLNGEETFRGLMADGAIMIFPMPGGLISGQQILDSLEANPRWRSVTMEKRELRHQGDTVILAYLAHADREGEAIYDCWCASTYVRDGDHWKMMSHQQSPVTGS